MKRNPKQRPIMRRVLSILPWIVKTLLLIVAPAALFAWIWSYTHPGSIGCTRWWLSSDRADGRDFACGWMNGRIVIGRWWWTFSKDLLDEGRRQAGQHNPTWTWEYEARTRWWMDPPPGSSWGPFRQDNLDSAKPDLDQGRRILSFPAWLVALLASFWPAISIALLIRRRRLRRFTAIGCCSKCGYDLRATPSPSGSLLPICPECGAANPASTAPVD